MFSPGAGFSSKLKSSSFNFRKDLVVMLDASDPTSFTTADVDLNGRQHCQTWNDKSGNGNHYTLGSTGLGPDYFSTFFGGKGGMAFVQSGVKSMRPVSNITPATYSNNMTVFYVMQRNTAYQGPTLVNTPSNEVLEAFLDVGTIGWNGPTQGVSGPRAPFLTDMMYTTVMPTTGIMEHYIGNIGPVKTFLGSTGHPYSTQIAKLQIGASPLIGGTGDFKLGLFLVYNRAFTASEVTKLRAYVKNVLGWNIAQPARPYNFVMAGNSLTDSRGIAEDVWPVKLPKLMNIGQNNFIQAGIGGQSFTDMLTRDVANVDAYYDPVNYLAKHNVVLVWEITNALVLAGATPASVQNLISTYCLARKAVGWKVIVGTCLPRDTAKANFEADRQTINQWVRDNYLTFADKIADFGADATIGQAGQQASATYYIGDGVHLSAAGHAIIASIYKTQLDAVIA